MIRARVRPVRLRGLGAFAALVAAGCAFGYQRPSVRVADVRLASLGFTGGRMRVVLDVENPNGFDLEGRDLEYTLAFAEGGGEDPRWLTLSEGVLAEPVRVPARGSGAVDIELPFDFATVGRALGSLLRRGELEYRFSGALRVRTRYGGSRVPFDERGVFRP